MVLLPLSLTDKMSSRPIEEGYHDKMTKVKGAYEKLLNSGGNVSDLATNNSPLHKNLRIAMSMRVCLKFKLGITIGISSAYKGALEEIKSAATKTSMSASVENVEPTMRKPS